jgi:hypothetical protein
MAVFDEAGEQVFELQRDGWLGMVAHCLRQWGATIGEIEQIDVLLPNDKHVQFKRQSDGSWWWVAI